jgi:hypothetical protein
MQALLLPLLVLATAGHAPAADADPAADAHRHSGAPGSGRDGCRERPLPVRKHSVALDFSEQHGCRRNRCCDEDPCFGLPDSASAGCGSQISGCQADVTWEYAGGSQRWHSGLTADEDGDLVPRMGRLGWRLLPSRRALAEAGKVAVHLLEGPLHLLVHLHR